MKPICLVLHLNQNVTAFASVAAMTSYRRLLAFLRDDPTRRVTLHVSGTLMIALGWLEPDVLTGLREVVASGQVELLGSTFAQNIPHVTPVEDNDLQIDLHRRWLRDWFGVRARGFWNPERCWGAAYAELISRAGFAFTFLEDHIIETGGLPWEASAGVTDEGLVFVRDDHRLRQLVNARVWGHGGDELEHYLDGSPRPLFCFAEDAEAIGLWALEQRQDPEHHWQRLTALVLSLQQRGYELATCSTALASTTPVAMRIPPPGQASWMVEALNQPGSRFHEAGFADWFDYARRNDKLQEQLALVAATRAVTLPVLVKRDGLTPIEAQVQVSYCTHQYELGCIGVLTLGPGQFTKLRNAGLLVKLDELVRDPAPAPRWVELDHGGVHLDVAITAHDVVAVAAGSIVAWFDRVTGHSLVASDIETSIDDPDDGKPMVDEVQMWIDNYRHGRDALDPQGLVDAPEPRFTARHRRVLLFRGTAVPELRAGEQPIALAFAGATYSAGRMVAQWTSDVATIERELTVSTAGIAIRDRIARTGGEPLRYVVRHSFSPAYELLAREGSAALTSIPGGAFVDAARIGVQLREHAGEVGSPGTGLLATLIDLSWTIGEPIVEVGYTLHKLRSRDVM